MNTAGLNQKEGLVAKNNNHNGMSGLKNKLKPLIFIGPHLLFFCVFFIIPFFFGIFISFTKWDLLGKIEWQDFGNYKQIWDISGAIDKINVFSESFFNGLKNTGIFVIVMVPLLIIVPLIFALVLNKLARGQRLIQAILYAPSLLSVATVALTWRWLFDFENGYFNNFIFLNNPINFVRDHSWLCVFVLTLWAGVGGNLVIFLAGLSGISKTYYEAADVDGANAWIKFWKITLPELSFQLLYTTVMGTIGAFNVYGQPAMFGVVKENWVLMQYIQDYAFGDGNAIAGIASAMSVSLGLVISVFSLIQFRLMDKKD